MALTYTVVESGSDSANTTTGWSTASWAPVADDTYLFFVNVTEAGGVPATVTLSGNSATWDEVTADTWGSPTDDRWTVFRMCDAAPTTGATAINLAGGAATHEGCQWIVVRVQGSAGTAADNGSGAIPGTDGFAIVDNTVGNENCTPTLTSRDAANGAVAFMAKPGTEVPAGEAGWSTAHTVAMTLPNRYAAEQHDDPSSDASAAFTWTGARDNGGVIIEIIPAAAGGETADIAQTLPSLIQAAVAEAIQNIDGAQTLPSLTQAALAEAVQGILGDSVLPALVQAAVANAIQEITGAQTLPALTQDVQASVEVITATLAQTLPALTQAIGADALQELVIAQALPALSQAATAEALQELVGASALPALVQALAADAVQELVGGQTLPAITQAVSVTVTTGLTGDIAQDLPALIQAAEADAVLEASAASILPALEQRIKFVFAGGGKDGYVVWRHTRNPDKTKRRLPFQGGPLR